MIDLIAKQNQGSVEFMDAYEKVDLIKIGSVMFTIKDYAFIPSKRGNCVAVLISIPNNGLKWFFAPSVLAQDITDVNESADSKEEALGYFDTLLVQFEKRVSNSGNAYYKPTYTAVTSA